MPLETGSYISDLVSANPLTTDQVSQGDDHLRLIKSVLKTTFPSISGAVSKSHTDLNNGVLPIGSIILWYGSLATLPVGWGLCDGTVRGGITTPNLVDRVAVGAGSLYAQGSTGGSTTSSSTGGHTHSGALTSTDGFHSHGGSVASAISSSSSSSDGGHNHPVSFTDSQGSHNHTATTSSDGSHDHAASTGGHALTLAEIPSHDHLNAGLSFVAAGGGSIGLANGSDQHFSSWVDSSQGSGLSHVHTIGPDGSHAHSVTTSSDGAHTHNLLVSGDGTHSHTISTSTSVSVSVAGDGSHNHSVTNPLDGAHTHVTTQPYVALYYIMRYA